MIGTAEIEVGPIEGAVRSDSTIVPLLDTRKHLHKNWHPRINFRLKNSLVKTLYDLNRCREALDVDQCGTSFRVFKASSCREYLVLPFHCNHRLCQLCARKRSQRVLKRMNGLFPKMIGPKMITFTVKNAAHIDKDYFKWLRGCFSKLRRSKVWITQDPCMKCQKRFKGVYCDIKSRDVLSRAGKKSRFRGCEDCCPRFDKFVSGGIYSIETTFNQEKQNWHPHIHCLVDSPGKLMRWDLSHAWERITEGSWGVDIRRAYDPREVVKYETKASDFASTPERVGEYLEAVKGSRLYHSFGSFFSIEKEESQEDESKPKSFSCGCGSCTWQFFRFIAQGSDYEDEQGVVWRWDSLWEFCGNTS